MNRLSGLLKPSLENDLYTLLRVGFIRAMAIFAIGMSLLGIAAQLVSETQTITLAITAGVFLCGVGLYILMQRRLLDLASVLLVTVFVLTSLRTETAFVLVAVLALVCAATLVSVPVYVAANVILFGKYVFELVQTPLTPDGRVSPEGTAGLAIMSALIVVSAAMRYFTDSARKSVRTSVRSVELLQITADISHAVSAMMNLKDLLNRSAELIRDRFGIYHVQIYIIDDTGEQAVLTAATGDEGQQLLDYNFRLSVKEAGVVAQVIGSATLLIARDSDAPFRRYPVLPSTRVEAAFPILEGSQVIGVLDIHSNRHNAFPSEEIQALQTMANLLGTAIRNALLFEAQNRTLREQQRLVIASETNLREIQRLNQQLTQKNWGEYLNTSDAVAGVTLRNNLIEREAQWSESLVKASAARRPVVVEQDDQSGSGVVAVPVILRGEVIGAIEVEPGEGGPNPAAVEMVQSVAQRLALSLDNARLFEESQAATLQEQRINQIAARYQEAGSVDELLSITLTELSQALGAQRGSIRLGTATQTDGQGGAAR